jgi:hypothetical protein
MLTAEQDIQYIVDEIEKYISGVARDFEISDALEFETMRNQLMLCHLNLKRAIPFLKYAASYENAAFNKISTDQYQEFLDYDYNADY